MGCFMIHYSPQYYVGNIMIQLLAFYHQFAPGKHTSTSNHGDQVSGLTDNCKTLIKPGHPGPDIS